MAIDVVVVGLGATTPLGEGVDALWAGLLGGRSGVRSIEAAWVNDDFPVRIAGQSVSPRVEQVRPTFKVLRNLDRSQQFAMVAAREAWMNAGMPSLPGAPDCGAATGGGEAEISRWRLAVVVGTGIGGALSLLNQDDILEKKGARFVSPHTVPMLMPNGPAAVVELMLGARGGAHCLSSACATGTEALWFARLLLQSGELDAVMVVGTEAVIHPVTLAGFASARAISTRNDDPARASRPFDVQRDGFVMSEGAGALLLTTAEFARSRGLRAYARLAGAAVSSDAHSMVEPDPAGEAAEYVMRRALEQAGLTPDEVQLVNAHATSTPVGDVIEARTIRRVFGEGTVVSANKGALGHLLGAAGTVEAIATILSLHHAVVPPSINIDELDPEIAALGLRIPRIPGYYNHGEQAQIKAAFKSSYGFGGHNAGLVFTRV